MYKIKFIFFFSFCVLAKIRIHHICPYTFLHKLKQQFQMGPITSDIETSVFDFSPHYTAHFCPVAQTYSKDQHFDMSIILSGSLDLPDFDSKLGNNQQWWHQKTVKAASEFVETNERQPENSWNKCTWVVCFYFIFLGVNKEHMV